NTAASSGGVINVNEQEQGAIGNDSQHNMHPPHPGHSGDQPRQESPSPQASTATQPRFASVDTPRALLTRDPHTLVELFANGQIRNDQQRTLLLEQMEGIRHQIALEMCQKSCTGQNVLREPQRYRHQSNPLIPGASMSALLMKDLQQEGVSSAKVPYTISTGCRALDDMIAFPEEFEYSPGNQHLHPKAVDADADADEARGPIFRKGGLPRGYVMSLTGTTGKTQLCLQLAAQACLQTKERVRYFYSTAGHSGLSLARRLKQLLDVTSGKSAKYQQLKRVEFVPIANSSQLLVGLGELEEEWIQRKRDLAAHMHAEASSDANASGVCMILLDSWPLMLVDKEETESMRYVERWLKRMARQHSMWNIVTGVGPTSAAPLDAADVRLRLLPETSTLTNLSLIQHPAKLVTNKDNISILNTNDFGLTTQG
ncbi:MAG: hypothetical protein SGILL_008599, partial [Bacillariaceae sp.]